jgi:hypothetical protein
MENGALSIAQGDSENCDRNDNLFTTDLASDHSQVFAQTTERVASTGKPLFYALAR